MKIENTSAERIESLVAAQRRYFASGATLSRAFRQEQLRRLQQALKRWQQPLYDALWNDLHKSEQEAILTEISIVEGEIRLHLRKLKQWMRRRSCSTPLKMMPSRSFEVSEPLGCSLIIAPWNYPLPLLLNPLVGAISSGCTAILKPSPYVPNLSRVVEQMVAETFEEQYVAVVQGNREVNAKLLEQRYDIIFFTGSPSLGRTVMSAAARNLTPVVLELGGKSPCIVDKGANVKLAAKRIAWGKTLNAGQTCIAPDYLLLHDSLHDEFVKAFKDAVEQLHGTDVAQSKHYVRMVNQTAYERVSGYLEQGVAVVGGEHIASERFIAPTLLDGVSLDADVMQQEIFGPVLPIIPFSEREQVVRFVCEREKPLALYYFGDEKAGWDIVHRTSSGGACINDTIMHIANENLPFGGVGNSGMGNYHGRRSFDTFSHRRAVVVTPRWIDLPFRYMPYKMFSLVKKLL